MKSEQLEFTHQDRSLIQIFHQILPIVHRENKAQSFVKSFLDPMTRRMISDYKCPLSVYYYNKFHVALDDGKILALYFESSLHWQTSHSKTEMELILRKKAKLTVDVKKFVKISSQVCFSKAIYENFCSEIDCMEQMISFDG